MSDLDQIGLRSRCERHAFQSNSKCRSETGCETMSGSDPNLDADSDLDVLDLDLDLNLDLDLDLNPDSDLELDPNTLTLTMTWMDCP